MSRTYDGGPMEATTVGDVTPVIAPLVEPVMDTQEDSLPPSGGNDPSEGAPVVKHPAKYSPEIVAELARLLDAFRVTGKVLDPFAGVGGIHQLRTSKRETWAIELEPEWAQQSALHGPTVCADFFDITFPEKYAAVVTSPTYGNRMADTYDGRDGSKRMTYTTALGRPLSEGSSAGMQWGDDYRDFHQRAWERVFDEVVADGGHFLLNVKDHIRDGHKQPVAQWHKAICKAIGFGFVADVSVGVRGMGFGANGKARVENEHILVFVKNP
jgi:hypothetical protein